MRYLVYELKGKVHADLSKEIRDRRKKLWPKRKKAREGGKEAFFDRRTREALFDGAELVGRCKAAFNMYFWLKLVVGVAVTEM